MIGHDAEGVNSHVVHPLGAGQDADGNSIETRRWMKEEAAVNRAAGHFHDHRPRQVAKSSTHE